MITFKEMSSFPPEENPFCHDLCNMGVRLGNNVMVMYRNHDHEICEYLIIVNTETGERMKVFFRPEVSSLFDEKFQMTEEGKKFVDDIALNEAEELAQDTALNSMVARGNPGGSKHELMMDSFREQGMPIYEVYLSPEQEEKITNSPACIPERR